jgi:hypothetical protein
LICAIDELVAIVSGEKATVALLLWKILRYGTQKQAKSEGLPELDRAARQMLLNMDVDRRALACHGRSMNSGSFSRNARL